MAESMLATIRIDKELWQQFKQNARSQGTNASAAIIKYISTHADSALNCTDKLSPDVGTQSGSGSANNTDGQWYYLHQNSLACTDQKIDTILQRLAGLEEKLEAANGAERAERLALMELMRLQLGRNGLSSDDAEVQIEDLRSRLRTITSERDNALTLVAEVRHREESLVQQVAALSESLQKQHTHTSAASQSQVSAQRSEVGADVMEVAEPQPNTSSDYDPATLSQTSNFSSIESAPPDQPAEFQPATTTPPPVQSVPTQPTESQPQPTTPPPFRNGDLGVVPEIESTPQPLERKATSSMLHRPATDAPEADAAAYPQPGISSGSELPQEGLLSEEPGGEPLVSRLQPDLESTLPAGGTADAIASGGHQQPIAGNGETTPVTNSDRSPTITISEIVQPELFPFEQPVVSNRLNHGENVQPTAETTSSTVGGKAEVEFFAAAELATMLGVHYSSVTQAAAKGIEHFRDWSSVQGQGTFEFEVVNPASAKPRKRFFKVS